MAADDSPSGVTKPPAPVAGRLVEGARVGGYVIARHLGQGGMGSVYEARHELLGRRVAIKLLRAGREPDQRAQARLLREARAAGQVRHPNVVPVFDAGWHDGLPFLVMDLLEGEDLASLLARRGRLAADEIARLFVPVAAAVSAAHGLGIVHRDLKPGNLFLARVRPRRIEPMVLDFGVSKIASEDADPTLTDSASLLGTLLYMSPEQTGGAGEASARSDQYALGVMMYECVTGQHPFAGLGHYALMHAIMTAPIRPPHKVAPEIPASFSDVVMRALERSPGRRFGDVAELGRALLPFAGAATEAQWAVELGAADAAPSMVETAGDAAGPGAARPPARPGRGRLRRLLPVALAVAAVAIVAGWLGLRRLPGTPRAMTSRIERAAPPADPLVTAEVTTATAEVTTATAEVTTATAAAAVSVPSPPAAIVTATLPATGKRRGARPALRRGQMAELPRAAPGGDAAAAPRAPAATVAPPETGTNEALILP